MTQPARRRATYADLEALPPNVVGEIINGQLYAFPRPRPEHATVTSDLGGILYGEFHHTRGHLGGWRILDEPELHLVPGTEESWVPDLAGWRIERMPRLPSEPFFTLPPDWVCEVLSPSTEAVDRGQKMPVYGGAGVFHAWLIDLEAQTLEAFGNDAGVWRLIGTWRGTVKARIPPFEAFELDLGSLWP